MGQYRQWLHYRDIDHRLQTQREQLAHELAQLHTRLQQAGMSQPDVDNSIFQALLHSAQPHNAPSESEVSFNEDIPSPAIPAYPLPPASSVPPHAIHAIQLASLSPSQQVAPMQPNESGPRTVHPGTPLPPSYAPLPPLPPLPLSSSPTPYHQNNLLPEDMNSFLDAHSQTDPQLTIPWWLRRAASTSPDGSLDPQSVQTNRLVQRWLERWGKQPPHEEQGAQNGNQ